MPRVSVGKSGSIRAHCSSENQKKSAIAIPPRRRQVNHISLALGIPFMGPDPRNGCRFMTAFLKASTPFFLIYYYDGLDSGA